MHINISNYIQVLETIYCQRMSEQIKDKPEGQDQKPKEIKLTLGSEVIVLRPVLDRLRNNDWPQDIPFPDNQSWIVHPQTMKIGYTYFMYWYKRMMMIRRPYLSESDLEYAALSAWNYKSEKQKKNYCTHTENQLAQRDQVLDEELEFDCLPYIKKKVSNLRKADKQKQQESKSQKNQQKKEEVHQINKPAEAEEHRVPQTQINQSPSSSSVQAAVSNSLSTCIANAELNCPQIVDPKQKFILVECNNIELNEQEIQKLTNELIDAKNQSPTKQYETIAIVQQDVVLPANTQAKDIGQQIEKVPQTDTQIVIKPNEDYKVEKEALGISQKPENEC